MTLINRKSIKNIFYLFFFVFCINIVLFFLKPVNIVLGSDILTAEPATPLLVDRYNECRVVNNTGSTSLGVFVGSEAEWLAFILYAPHVDLNSCGPFGSNFCSLPGVTFCHGTEGQGMIVFKTVGSYTVPVANGGVVEVLVVAGGGSGGRDSGGGGGGGGLLYNNNYSLTSGNKTVIVGARGTATANGTINTSGGNSRFDSLISVGGGRGGHRTIWNDGGSGGSGGGGRGAFLGFAIGGSGTSGQGFSGGDTTSMLGGGGGGGGKTGSGVNGGTSTGGRGGYGANYFGWNYAAGGGGGGGGRDGYGGSAGGSSAGAGGRQMTNASAIGETARAYSGGGGGGGGHYYYAAGHGGSGIVIVRWGGYYKNYNATTNAVTNP